MNDTRGPSPVRVAPSLHGGARLVCEHCGKTAYATEEDADFAVRKISRGSGHRLSPYHDGECGWWHLTTQREGDDA